MGLASIAGRVAGMCEIPYGSVSQVVVAIASKHSMITLELPRTTATEREAWQGLGVSRAPLVRFLREAQAAAGVQGEVAVLLAADCDAAAG